VSTVLVCLTVLAVAAIAAWLINELVKDASSTRLVLADKQRQAAVDAAAAAAPARELADAVRALQITADRLTPAPVRAGKPTTIHTRDEKTITGVLLEEFADRTRLGDARYVTAQGETPVPGSVATVLKINEAWRQEHEA
jgi:hypothetical protein